MNVPQGQPKIAHRFNGSVRHQNHSSPARTAENPFQMTGFSVVPPGLYPLGRKTHG
jgi:hypothetical protein